MIAEVLLSGRQPADDAGERAERNCWKCRGHWAGVMRWRCTLCIFNKYARG